MLKQLKELNMYKRPKQHISLKGNTHSDIYCNRKWYGIPVQDHDRMIRAVSEIHEMKEIVEI